MSGRGRGKQSASNRAPIPMVGISLNQNALTPPDIYPVTFFKPIKFESKKEDLFLVNLKQKLRNSFKNSQFYIKEKKEKITIERYSDKYESILNQPATEQSKVWNYDLFPDELKPKLKNMKDVKQTKKVTFDDLNDKLNKLDKLEKADEDDENVEDEEKDNEEIDGGQVEEEIEEETDYALSYFDNGEDYLNESDDNLGGDEATF